MADLEHVLEHTLVREQRVEVGMARAALLEACGQHGVAGDLRLVQQFEDAKVRSIDELTDGLVVKVVDLRPVQALADVQLLLVLQDVHDKVLRGRGGGRSC